MKKEKIILQLGVEIDTLKAHIQRLKRDNYKLHQLDVELLQQKTRQFYDMLFELENQVETQIIASSHSKSIASPSQNTKAEKAKETPHPKEEVVAKVKKIIAEPPRIVIEKAEEKVEETKPEKPAKEIEIVQQEVPLEVVEVENIGGKKQIEPEVIDKNPEPKTEEIIENQADLKSNFDLFSENSTTTVSDKFTDIDKQSLADKMQGSQITDLRQSIGINEKFLFINELFKGNMGRYNKVIDELNELKTLIGAQTFLLEIKVQNQWGDELEAYLKLKELVERKFK